MFTRDYFNNVFEEVVFGTLIATEVLRGISDPTFLKKTTLGPRQQNQNATSVVDDVDAGLACGFAGLFVVRARLYPNVFHSSSDGIGHDLPSDLGWRDDRKRFGNDR